jgi:hypothetical protein
MATFSDRLNVLSDTLKKTLANEEHTRIELDKMHQRRVDLDRQYADADGVVTTFSVLFRISNPGAADFVARGGQSLLAMSRAVNDLSKGFSAAATGNLFAGAYGLFSCSRSQV